MKKYFNKKSLIIVGAILILAVIVSLNYDNIKKITGNIEQESDIKTTINDSMIENMRMYDIVGEIESDLNNGSKQYINFNNLVGNTNKTKMSILQETKADGIYLLRSIFKFSNNINSKKQIRVTLDKSVRYSYDGYNEIQKDLLINKEEQLKACEENSDSENCKTPGMITENVTNELEGVEYNFANGTKTYNLKSSVEITTLALNISPNSLLEYSTVSDAIVIELIEDGVVKTTKKIGIDFDFSAIPVLYSGYNEGKKQQYGSYLDTYINEDRLIGFYYYIDSATRSVFFKDIIYTLNVPKGAVYEGLYKEISTLSKSSFDEFSCSKYDENGKEYSCSELINDKRDYDIYKFKLSSPYINSISGLNPKWSFPKEKFSVGTDVQISVEKIEYQVYGDNRKVLEGANVNVCNNKKCVVNFKIVEDDVIEISKDKISLDAYNDADKEALIGLSILAFYNKSPLESKNEKEIVYEFSENVSVKEIHIPIINEKETRICYKSDKKTNWTCKDNFLLKDEYSTNSYNAMKITLEDFNDSESNEITAFMYNIGKVPGNYSANAQDISMGHIKEIEIIEDGKKEKSVPSSFSVKYSINDAGYLEKVLNKETVSNLEHIEVERESVNINQNQKLEIYPINSVKHTNNSVFAGTKAEYESKIQLYASSNILHRNIYKPIIYIRNQIKEPLKNIKLSLANKSGIIADVTDKFNISFKKDEDGYYIYKIEIKENEIVKIGYDKYKYDINSFQWLLLNYDIDIPKSFYNINNFNLSNTVFVDSYDSVVTTVNNNEIKIGDLYDLDFDGKTTEDKMNSAIKENLYRIVSYFDLNVDIKQKSSDETNYVYKENTNIDLKKLLNLNVIINNPVEKNIENSVIYIPIPKSNSKFLNQTFKSDMVLDEFIKENDDKIEISYSNEKNIISYEDFSKISFLPEDKININDVSVIKISLVDINPEETKNLYYNLRLTSDIPESISESFNFTYYRNFKFESTVRTGYENGNDVLFTMVPSKYNLKVIHKTIYDIILEVENKEYTYNAEYKTNPIIKEGFEFFEILGEESGFIKENTEITYIYRPSKLIEVKIEHILKDTNQKIIDDVVLKGKVLDYYSYEPKEISGYKLLDNKKISGNYDEHDKIYKVYYEKNKVNNPKTFDEIIIYVILFIVSLLSIISCAYILRKKVFINKDK